MYNIGLEKLEDKEIVKMLKFLLKKSRENFDLEQLDLVFLLYINYCKEHKMYKKALELSEDALMSRRFGVNYNKNT